MIDFLNPLAFWWSVPAVGAIVLLYILKLKRKNLTVSSVLFWQSETQDISANAPFQRLRPNLLMLIQIIIALLLIAALARPTAS